MNKKHFASMVIVSVVSGLVGGVISILLLMPPSVLAQGEPEKQTVEAESFVLKDAQGRMRAELGTSLSDSPVLWLYD